MRLQTQSLLVDSIKPGVGADTATVASGGKLFAGPWDCFKKTLKVEGVRGLYQVEASENGFA